MKIILISGIVPPALGGPAEYAAGLLNVWQGMGHKVVLFSYTIEKYLPTGIRHFVFFCKMLPSVFGTDAIVALDTMSVGLPGALLARICGKKLVIRVGGDFLWEQYVERTGDLVVFREFYDTTREKWTQKEKIIFSLTRFTLHSAHTVAFNTDWQKEIWQKVYELDGGNIKTVENFFPPQEKGIEPTQKVFIGSTRKLVWKNIPTLQEAFSVAQTQKPEISLELGQFPHDIFLQKIKESYAVILVSLGDIGPNLLVDAVRFGKPFIATKECGLRGRLGEIGIWVDPKNKTEIAQAILWLSDEKNYATQCEKVRRFAYTHSWQDIAQELLA